MSGIVGKGSYTQSLTDAELTNICEEALSSVRLGGKKVLVLIPDHTSRAPVTTRNCITDNY